jgi:lysozyme family protein
VAKAIYRKRYWDAQRCDDLPAGIDYAVFDYGVNSGIGRSGKVLRRVLGMPDEAGTITDAVVAAARAADAAAVITAICNERLRFLKSLKTWDVFGKGWGRRVAEVEAAALAMTQPRAAASPVSAKAGGAVAAAGAAAAVAHQAGLPLVLVIGIALAASFAAALVIHLFKSRKG